MKHGVLCCFSALALVAASGFASAQLVSVQGPTRPGNGGSTDINEYTLDDGVGEANIGLNGAASSIAWLNRFTVSGGNSTITDIRIAFGTNNPAVGGTPFNGVPVTAYLWSDPNNDGNPSDAVVLASAAGITANSLTDIFNVFTIPATNVGPDGTNFFVGAILTQAGLLGTGPGSFPCRQDNTPVSQGRSWIAGNVSAVPVNPNSLGAGNAINAAIVDSFGPTLAGDWMIRASAVPAPGTLALLGLGGLVIGRRRR